MITNSEVKNTESSSSVENTTDIAVENNNNFVESTKKALAELDDLDV